MHEGYTAEVAPWRVTYVTAESTPLTTWLCIAETVVHAPKITVVLTNRDEFML